MMKNILSRRTYKIKKYFFAGILAVMFCFFDREVKAGFDFDQTVDVSVSGYNTRIQIDFTIHNNGSNVLKNISLSGYYKFDFSSIADLSGWNVSVQPPFLPAANGFAPRTDYAGSGNLLAGGAYLNPGETAYIRLTFLMRLNSKYKNQSLTSTAMVSSGGLARISSAPIPLTQITINGTAAYSASEMYPPKTYEIKITRKGSLSQPATVNYAITVPPAPDGVTIAAASAPGVDVVMSVPMTGSITFARPSETEKIIRFTVLDDQIYELPETFTFTITPAAPNISILQEAVTVTVTSDDPEPIITATQNKQNYIEGSAGDAFSTLASFNLKLSNASYLPVTVDWEIVSPGSNFNDPTSGTITFPPNTTTLTMKDIDVIKIRQDVVREPDVPFKVKFEAINGRMDMPMLEYKIVDDDLRQIMWMDQSPKMSAKKLHAGTGIVDTMTLRFRPTEADLVDPEIRIALPAGVEPITGFLQNINPGGDVVPVKFAGWNATTRMLTYKLDGATKITANQTVHFKIIRRADCYAPVGAKTDSVRVYLPSVTEYVEDVLVANKRSWGVTYNIVKAKLNLFITQGNNLTFVNEGDVVSQTLRILNSGQGALKETWLRIAFTKNVVRIRPGSFKVNGMAFPDPVLVTGTTDDYYEILLDDFAGTGNHDPFFDAGEELQVTYDFVGQPKTDAGCGLKVETITTRWACENPATRQATTIEFYLSEGVPILERTLYTPVNPSPLPLPVPPAASPLKEDNVTPNIYVARLDNIGTSDAWYTSVPFTVASRLTDRIVVAETEVWVDGVKLSPVTNVASTDGTNYMISGTTAMVNISHLRIPAGKTAQVIYKVYRKPMNRPDNVKYSEYFLHLSMGQIRYSDECGGNHGSIPAGYFTTHDNKYNISCVPALMTVHAARVEKDKYPVYSFELGSINSVFPIADKKGFFDGAETKRVVITLNTGGNQILPQNVRLISSDGATTHSGLEFTNSADNPVTLPIDPAAAEADGIYKITIPWSEGDDAFFQKNSRLEIKVTGSCGASHVFPVRYTVDFITGSNVAHRLYTVTDTTLVKCATDPGANLKDQDDPNARYVIAERSNIIKGDANNNGLDDGTADHAIDKSKMRLDRFYHGDTLQMNYEIVVVNDPNLVADGGNGVTKPWEYLYITLDKMSRFTHVETRYWHYQKGTAGPISSGTLSPKDAGEPDKVYFEFSDPGHLFYDKDSIVIQTEWRANTMTPVGNNYAKLELAQAVKHWVYCQHSIRNAADVFKKLPANNGIPLGQNYERYETALQLYSLGYDTDGIHGPFTFNSHYASRNVTYDYQTAIGEYAGNNTVFPYELRQPYYVDTVSFKIPWGYRITDPVRLFGQNNAGRLGYGAGAPYDGFIYDGFTMPEMQGNTRKITFPDMWDDKVREARDPSLYQVPEEGWKSTPFIAIEATPKAPPGETLVHVNAHYQSPEDNIPDMSVDNTFGFVIRNNAPGMILTCGTPVQQAMSDTITWTVRIENKSANFTAKNAYLYIGNMVDDSDFSIEGYRLYNLGTGGGLVGAGTGYRNRWIKVGDIPESKAYTYHLSVKITDWAGHCDGDTLYISPWFDYKSNNEQPQLDAPLDTLNDLHAGRSIQLIIEHQQSHITGEITPMTNTPTDPSNPSGAKFGTNIIEASVPFPVEIKLSSAEVMFVTNPQLRLHLPVGMKYVPQSAYFQADGNVPQAFATQAETGMVAGGDGSGNPFMLSMSDVTNNPDFTLKGVYKTTPEDRTITLRFLLNTECTFQADSAVIRAEIFGNRPCGTVAGGNGDTVAGDRIFLRGFRYYTLRSEITGPDGYIFAVCDPSKTEKTLAGSFRRTGIGELQDDYFELEMPAYFKLDPNVVPVIRYSNYSPDPPALDMAEDPTTVYDERIEDGVRKLKWKLPVAYSAKTNQDIIVDYDIPVVLDPTASGLEYANDFVLTIHGGSSNICQSGTSILATDTLVAYVYTNEIGLAKDVTRTLNADSYYDVTYTYTIVNYSNVPMINVMIEDNLLEMFDEMVDVKDFQVTASNVKLDGRTGYTGNGMVLSSGVIEADSTETVTLKFKARPNMLYDGREFKNNARIYAANMQECAASDNSTLGTDPKRNDPDVAANTVPTPIKFSSLRFRQSPPVYNVDENYGEYEIIIERVGDLSAYSFDVGFIEKSMAPTFALVEPYSEARLGTSAEYGIDAWRSSLTDRIAFAANETQKSVKIHVADDRIDEEDIDEAFVAYIANPSNPDISLTNDTAVVAIRDNDLLPTITVSALNDSISEGTAILGAGHNYGTKKMTFVVKLSNPTHQTVEAQWETTGGTATGGPSGIPGLDYDYVTQPPTAITPITLTYAASDTIQYIYVEMIADSIPEMAKTVQVTLSDVESALPGVLTAVSTIVDDDIKISTLLANDVICKDDRTGAITVKARGGETGVSSGAYHYSWTGPNGFTASHFTLGDETVSNLTAGSYTVTVTDAWSQPTDTSFTFVLQGPADALSVVVDQITPLSCFEGRFEGAPVLYDGAIATTLSGGWPGSYTVSWEKDRAAFPAGNGLDDLTGLQAGTYIIHVVDSENCNVSDTVVVTQPDHIAIASFVKNDILCKGDNNGSIDLDIQGGNPAYFINWTGTPEGFATNAATIASLLPGQYRVTVGDIKGCEFARADYTVEEPAAALSASVLSTADIACKEDHAGEITIDVLGGWGQYAYTWSDGAATVDGMRDQLPAGTYHVIVADSASCTVALSNIVVSEPAVKLAVDLAVVDETFQSANDGTITVNVSGGQPEYTYTWADQPSLSAAFRNHLQAGSYTVTVTDQWQCVITETATVAEPSITANLPTAFTPDGDGYNDRLLEQYRIRVYDRWGYLIYEGGDGWDGRYKGQLMPAGTYFYILMDEVTGKEYKSSVLLQR